MACFVDRSGIAPAMRPGRIGLSAALAVVLGAAAIVGTATATAPRPIRQARRAALRDAYRRLEKSAAAAGHADPVKAIGKGLHLDGPGGSPPTRRTWSRCTPTSFPRARGKPW